jgi:soluble lytic murein transglycosylase
MAYRPSVLGSEDAARLSAGLAAVKSGNLAASESYRSQISDPVARNLIRWAQVDGLGNQLSFLELDGARRDLSGWPRGATRQARAERALETAVMDPARVLVWFDGAKPQTPEGAMTLASALQAQGRAAEAQVLVRDWWRNHLFEADAQSRMLARFGSTLSAEDHAARLRTLLLGPQGPALQALLPLVSEDDRALAAAAVAHRNGAGDATAKFNALPASVANDPVIAFERARYLRQRNMDTLGTGFVRSFPRAPDDEDAADRLWLERRMYYNAAVKRRDWQTAYAAMTNHGFTGGERLVEAEFFAGWIALTRLNNPAQADKHFQVLETSSSTPITQGRAAFWRGRAAEARQDAAAAQAFYQRGAKHSTAFYGQLAAEKAGITTLTLAKDPIPTDADRARFDARPAVRAARMLAEAGERDLFRAFVLAIDDTLPSAEEIALLVDLARYYGDQDLAMRVIRGGAQRGFILAERGYPVVAVPQTPGSAETAFALSIARQESNFYPGARSAPGARGMMQLMPATGRAVARRLGVPYDDSRLYEAEYNLRLGAYHLGELIEMFGGSYVMAAAGYNAGPGRPATWAGDCGDPRGGSTDPIEFIECIPFSETRNYVMRTLETTQIYRARLNGGTAPLMLSSDLKRGAYGYRTVYTPPVTTPTPADPSPLNVAPASLRPPVASTRPKAVSTQKACSPKTRAKASCAKAKKGKSSATKRPSSKSKTRSAKRPARQRS